MTYTIEHKDRLEKYMKSFEEFVEGKESDGGYMFLWGGVIAGGVIDDGYIFCAGKEMHKLLREKYEEISDYSTMEHMLFVPANFLKEDEMLSTFVMMGVAQAHELSGLE